MRTTSLGTTGPAVPVQGLGCMRLLRPAAPSAPDDEADAFALVNRALDLGVTFLDTADLYGDGYNEELVGRAIRHRRDEVVLGTKFGAVRNPDDSFSTRGDAAYARAACEASLRRLGTDVIDLYYLHRRDPAVPIEESVGAMADLVAEGKVRHLGLSEVTAEELRAAHAVHPIAALQNEWSLCRREIEAVVPTCVELGVGVVPYCPHGRGLLLPGAKHQAQRLGEIAAELAALPAALREIADEHGVRPGQVALAWVQQRAVEWGLPVVPIPGTTRQRHLEENIAAVGIVLSAEQLARLDIRVGEAA
ncbi:aryl-alcohol dehydrogenase-like predicted oxidoreductase [Saccharopolyspora erythraea NRRL 2338]|nr:aldo/keto reductase [Saccharopolyspora erythraea]PFG94368.1 aryl-alcohol dehydrogenase-like predicted oxidoreductase [Saccharopolyspora erythraea NRRL 2338]QRK91138.1 aldo/keto reductase [Saccharopolyspora erythraea]